jgi:hypothetical protein
VTRALANGFYPTRILSFDPPLNSIIAISPEYSNCEVVFRKNCTIHSFLRVHYIYVDLPLTLTAMNRESYTQPVPALLKVE